MRLVIYPSDIQAITGKSIDTARRLYNLILDAYGKIYRNSEKKIIKKDLLTIDEFCKYSGLEREEVLLIINKKSKY